MNILVQENSKEKKKKVSNLNQTQNGIWTINIGLILLSEQFF